MRTSIPKSVAADGGKPVSSSEPHRSASPLAHLQRTAGNLALQRAMSGSPLPRELRSSLETYFKTPLDRVRVHTDSASQATADTLGARAFTVGQDIHLGSEGVKTSGSARKDLLAHEVVHTLQQGQVGPRAKLKVGSPNDAYERQAERFAAGFGRGASHAPYAIEHASESVVQRSMLPAHYYGQFEDFQYQDITQTGSGSPVGVEMYLKFHPGTEVRADLIGMTQALRRTIHGRLSTEGIRGMRQATTGAGTGYYIDRIEGSPNPLYAASQAPRAGGDAAALTGYDTVPITPLTPAQQASFAASSGTTGRRYNGWGKHGFRKVIAGNWVTEPAELYDAPNIGAPAPNSEQIFETAALAIAGPQAGTYYGSVEWGWHTDAAGTFTRLPARVVAQGVPTANFLTAASLWNPSRASVEYVTTSATNLIVTGAPNVAIPLNTRLTATGRSGTRGGLAHVEVTYGASTGWVVSTAVQATAIGAETTDLPIPMVQVVSNAAGTTMLLHTSVVPGLGASPTLALPRGTRVRTTRCMVPTPTLPNHDEGEVIDGPFTGTEGYFFVPDLTLEALGTR